MAGIKIVDLPALGRDLIATDLLELSLAGGTGSRKITGQEIINASKLNVGTTPIINGAVGQVLFQGTGNVLQESANLFWDNTNGRLGIGTGSPTGALHIIYNESAQSGIILRGTSGASGIFSNIDWLHTGTSAVLARIGVNQQSGEFRITAGSGGYFSTFYSNGSERMRIPTTGNVLIGTTTDAGFKLDVNGTARLNVNSGNDIITDAINVTLNGYAGSGSLIRFQSRNAAASLLYKFVVPNNTDTAGYFTGNVGIGTSTPAATLDVNGTARVQGQTTIIPNTFNILSTGSTLYFVDTLSNSYRVANQIGWGGYGSGGFTNNTADIFSIGLNGSSTANANYFFRVNLNGGNSSGPYGASGNNVALAQLNAPTAARLYLTAQGGGGLLDGGTSGFLISTISDGQNLSLRSERGTGGGGGGINYLSSINGSNHSHRFFHNNVEQMRLQFSGNLLINTTTDAGFRLDVNGTARIQGNTTITGTLLYLSHTSIGLSGNVGTGVLELFNSSGSAGNTRISLGGTTYLNIFQPISASSGITSGPINTITTPITYSWASGTASPNLFQLNPNYNFTGTYSGTVRGFYYNPTLTSITGVTHFAFHSTSGRVRFEGLPTSPTGLNAGDIYNDGGTLKIV